MWILNLPNDIIGEILGYCTQFDLHNLLLVNKAFYNHAVLRHELTELRKWCDKRSPTIYIRNPKYIYVDKHGLINIGDEVDNTIMVTDKKSKEVKQIIPYEANVMSYIYHEQGQNYYIFGRIKISEIRENLFYYDNANYYADTTDDIVLRDARLHVNIYIKNYFTLHKHSYVIGNYQFALY